MYNYRVALLVVLGLYVFSPVVIDWWLAPGGAWYQPFAIWFLLIVAHFAVGFKRGSDEF